MKDSTMHEKNQFRYRKKLVLTLQKASLNITKYQRILPKYKPTIWALIAHSMGTRCSTYGLSMPALRAFIAHVPG